MAAAASAVVRCLDDALAVLEEAFAAWPPAPPARSIPARDRDPSPRPAAAARAPIGPGDTGGARLRQHPAVVLHAVEDDLFLVDPRNQSIYHLNLVGAGLWRLLRAPTTAAEATDALQAAFPGADPQRIARDVGALLDDLLANGLIVPQDVGAAGSGPPARAPSVGAG